MVNWQEWIISDPAVMMGKPVITGTRITVELIEKIQRIYLFPRPAMSWSAAWITAKICSRGMLLHNT